MVVWMSLVKRLRRHSSNKRFYVRFSRFPSDDLDSKITAHCLETSYRMWPLLRWAYYKHKIQAIHCELITILFEMSSRYVQVDRNQM